MSSMKVNTRTSCLAASSRIRAAISEACTAEPPGELTTSATATMPLR